MKCSRCKTLAVKNGRQSNGKQRYRCKRCKVSFQSTYTYKAYKKGVDKSIYSLLTESVGVRAIGRLLKISKTTVICRIKRMASKLSKPILDEKHQYYELDEMRVVVGYKENQAWLTYAINRNNKNIIDFVVGRRTKRNISKITKSVLQLKPKMIFTDGLSTYKSLIPKEKHNTRKKNTTIIERHNLTLRIALKRLSRKTINYSKNFEMLNAIMKIYFWGNSLGFK